MLSFTTLQAEEQKNYWYGVLFLIIGIAIFESLEWCEHPVFLRVATKLLSGVIMGDVRGETTPVSELSVQAGSKSQSPEMETRMAVATRDMRETNIVLKTRKDHCDYLI